MRKFTKNNLFIIGRNVYQAACGNAWTATQFIEDFPAKTRGLLDAKRRALLDGMLFEAFFDSDGRLREEVKDRRFGQLFDLQRYESTTPSFDFIAECLLPYANKFHALPGKADEVAVDVVLEAREHPECPYVARVCIASGNLLRPEDDDTEFEEPQRYRAYSIETFEQDISTQLLIPQHLLSFTYTGVTKKPSHVNAPKDWTVRKHVD